MDNFRRKKRDSGVYHYTTNSRYLLGKMGLIAVLLAIVMGIWIVCSDAAAQTAKSQTKIDTVKSGAEDLGAKGAIATIAKFVKELFEISPDSIRRKSLRIVVILVIWFISGLIMRLITLVNRLIVYSKWGPLKYVFREHQRSMTINSLIISIIKYIIYFTAIGYILRELGINYRTYLASLSLIGIAVGFGSQGLVQDIVTGFFILFESQFSVGDMVEIAGQFGIVEEIGLRTSRLRNYLGELMIFPNRNIAVIGKFLKGAMEVCVDVAIVSKDTSEKAASQLRQIGEEFEKQFKEIILEKPRVSGLVVLKTGELFVRMQTRIWPQQQWVIDLQMVPRIREIFKREGIEIPVDRVVVFYHLPEAQRKNLSVVRRIRRMINHATSKPDSSEGEVEDLEGEE